jgi:hypothetical protein
LLGEQLKKGLSLRNLLLFFVTCFLLTTACHAGIKDDFFMSGLGPRSTSLGGSAFAFGTDSLLTNPAGLALKPNRQFSFGYLSQYDQLVSNTSFAYTDLIWGGVAGISVIQMENGGADKTIINEYGMPSRIGTFGESQLGISMAYAKTLDDKIAVGVGGRFYQNKLDTESATSLGFYTGFIYQMNPQWITGLSVNNLSPFGNFRSTINWSTGHVDEFPVRISGSTAYKAVFWEKQTEFYLDLHFIEVTTKRDFNMQWSGGTSVWVIDKIFAARAGFSGERLALGLGLEYQQFLIDYAFSQHQNLGQSQSLMLTMTLGRS